MVSMVLNGTAAAGALDQAHDGELEVVGHRFGLDVLFADRGVVGAAPNREVVAADHDQPAVQPGAAEDVVGGQEVGHLAVRPVIRPAAKHADLVEAAGIDQPLDPVPGRFRRELERWRSSFSGPPMARPSAWRRRSSRISGSQLSSVMRALSDQGGQRPPGGPGCQTGMVISGPFPAPGPLAVLHRFTGRAAATWEKRPGP